MFCIMHQLVVKLLVLIQVNVSNCRINFTVCMFFTNLSMLNCATIVTITTFDVYIKSLHQQLEVSQFIAILLSKRRAIYLIRRIRASYEIQNKTNSKSRHLVFLKLDQDKKKQVICQRPCHVVEWCRQLFSEEDYSKNKIATVK